MKLKFRSYLRPLLSALLLTVILVLSTGVAHADVFGRLDFTITDANSGKPIDNSDVIVHDTAGIHGDTDLVTDMTGVVTSQQLEARAWDVTVEADGYQTEFRTVTVAADTTTPVKMSLFPKQEKVINISGHKSVIQTRKTASSTVRSQTFIAQTPVGHGNPQSLGDLLIANPGVVQSTNNQVHPRGEHASTTIDIDGAEIPNATIGRGGQFISPETVQNVEILTGAYAPEYGSEAAAIINLNLKEGTIAPYTNFNLQGGGYSTFDGDLNLGGQSGQAVEGNVPDGPKDFRYFIDINNRSTDNALEPPQPDDQTAHNAAVTSTILGHFDYDPNLNDQFSLTLNTTPATTEVANRTGLSSYYAPVGQGYGYGGARDANGYLPGYNASNVGAAAPLGAYVPGVASQEVDGQDDYQDDNNTFGLLNFRHNFDPSTTGLLSFSSTSSITELKNNNPADNILNEFNPDGTLTTTDNSIEFNPDMSRSYHQNQVQGSVTKSQKKHTYKAGVIYDQQTGTESYQFTPQSQLALDALGNIYGFAPNVTLAGNPFLPSGTSGTGGTDALGNPIIVLAGAGESFPTVNVTKDGYYGAAYAQDTWNESSRFTINYGVRYDAFHQHDSTSNGIGYTNSTSLTKGVLSPRINTAYTFASQTVLRVSYDHLFTQPPLAQGAIVGYSIEPETWDQYETSVEKQIARTQTAKIDYYYKNIRNQDDTGILIPFTQIGALTTLNYQYASVHGLELSWDLNPVNNIGYGAFFGYTYSHAAPGGLNEVGTPAPNINDHNQYDTLTTGLDYTWKTKAYVSGTVYYGSGEASSSLGSVATSNGGNDGPAPETNLQAGHTIPREQVDLRLASAPKLLGFGNLQIDVINLFDSLAVENFNSGFSGTRFQQGRTVLLTTSLKF